MEDTAHRAIAIVGVGAVLPDAPNVAAFWDNIKSGRYCISDVPTERWNPDFYFNEDHSAPDKTYSKIGGWVRQFPWEPMKWRMPIPPLVARAMDEAQQWGLACTREALEDYGYPNRSLDMDRTAVILGNAMAGEKHYLTALRVYCPEYEQELSGSESFAALPEQLRTEILSQLRTRIANRLPAITEDSMPGELANCLAGRIANIFNFHGPNFTSDAACASTMAAMNAAINGLVAHDFDTVIAGGIDRNMGAPTFVKFCKIGALSATGSRPFADGADGFVMGEGAALFVLKRLADAEQNGDRIYAVIRGLGGSSDGRGKGITAPNPIGQHFAIERAWKNAGVSPETVTMIEAHGTSTKVGDLVEVESMMKALNEFGLPQGSVALGSVKSNIGHLKGAAAAAGLLKTTLSLHEKVLPPSVNCPRTNPNIDFAHSPLFVNTELRPWETPKHGVRRAGLSAFGFGGTNFHMVVEEYIPGRLNSNGKHSVAVSDIPGAIGNVPVANAGAGIANNAPATQPIAQATAEAAQQTTPEPAIEPVVPVETASNIEVPSQPSLRKAPLRGALVLGAETPAALAERLTVVHQEAAAGHAPASTAPEIADLRAPERIAIDYGDAAELADKAGKALKAMKANIPAMWKVLRAQGIFRGQGPAPKVAFLYTGQGSQYVNMIKDLRAADPVIAETFAEADEVLTPLLGKPLSDFIFIDGNDPKAVEQAENDLRQTAITQPAVIATDVAITRLLGSYNIKPDMAMGHSVGEYGALVVTGGLPFHDSMEAVSARGREMTAVSLGDNGGMAAVFAPLAEIERILGTIEGYVVIANINSRSQAVIGGETKAMMAAIQAFLAAGYNAVPLPVSHAFHTSIVAPASEPLKRMLERLHLTTPKLPTVSNVSGEFYPMNADGKAHMVEVLSKQVAAPVQFVKGLETLYNAGARVFVETGPKKALQGFAEDVLGDRGDVLSLFTNHPKLGDVVAFNQALCGLYASGLGAGETEPEMVPLDVPKSEAAPATPELKPEPEPVAVAPTAAEIAPPAVSVAVAPLSDAVPVEEKASEPFPQIEPTLLTESSVVITGASLGLPGTERVFDDSNIGRILHGEGFINQIPTELRRKMLDKHVTRLVKSDSGGAFETIDSLDDVIKLAGIAGAFDIISEFGISPDRAAALDIVTEMAMAAGIDALRDAGIPLVMRYKTTSKGTQLFDRWMLPESLRDDTGVIFGSAFPGYDSFADEIKRFEEDRARRGQVKLLESLHAHAAQVNGHSELGHEIARRLEEARAAVEAHPYTFDRRFLFRVLAMGHSQFAEFIGARGPNTQVNAACASTSQAIAIAEDWIRAGRCRRVIVVSADNITSKDLLGWLCTGFLASGAAATDEIVEEAALPFDRRRHGMIAGMGAAALVIERFDAVNERGIQPICEVLGTATANSAFHGTRLDVQHICQVMEHLVANVEKTKNISRHSIAPEMVFISHETYTPARGGSAAAEIHALRHVFGELTDKIVIANTKGFTGHAMGAGIEDVVAVKTLETGYVPPIPNFKEIDPELGSLNLSKGGIYPVRYALRLAAGFGSQISMQLLRWVETKDGQHASPDALGYQHRIVAPERWHTWLASISGNPTPELEVVQHTLRVCDPHFRTKTPEPVQETQPAPEPVLEAVPEPEPQPVAQAVPAEPAVTVEPTVIAEPEVIEVEPVSATIAAPEPPAAAVAGDRTQDPVTQQILQIVAEKTGYPVEMLDLDLDLEADLGVDTVKQAEVLATIREAYGIARDDSIKLRDYPTLSHVIRFVHERCPELGAQSPTPEVTETNMSDLNSNAAAKPAFIPASDSVQETILAMVVEKTGYPKEMLDLELDLEADLGIDTVKQAELFVAVRTVFDIPRDENLKLRDYPTLARVIQFVLDKRPDLAGAKPAAEPVKVEAAPAPVAAPVAAAAVALISEDEIKAKVLEIVAEKTGYPEDMLDLDLDLEADLGVDTVKQAEMFAAVRAAYNIARDENIKLHDFPTLAHVIKFACERQPGAIATAAPVAMAAAAAAATSTAPVAPKVEAAPAPIATTPAPAPVSIPAVALISEDEIKAKVLEIVAEKTGYPKDMLDLDLDLEADLGVDTVKQAEMFAAVRAAYNIARDENIKLHDFPTLAHVIKFAYERQPGAAIEAPKVEAAPAPIATTPAPTAVAIPAMARISEDEIKAKVLEIVAEKTGYPKDMLDLDLDLEADLGVDTVKQAEMFAAVRAAYNIARDENIKLHDFPTLAHVIKFAYDRQPGVAAAAAPKAEAQPAEAKPAAPKPAPRPRPAAASLDAANSIPRRVPVPILRPALELCKPSAVKLGPSSRVVLMPDKGGVAEALTQQLQMLGVEILRIEGTPDADTLVATLKTWMAAGPIQGVYWLPALNHEVSFRVMDLPGWKEALRVRVKLLYHTMRTLYEHIVAPNTFLVSATLLGGQHGYDEAGAIAPLGGAVVGMTKTYKRERADAQVKVVDFELGREAASMAQTLLDETLRDPGAVEIGYKETERWTVALQEQPAIDGQPGMVLDENTVFVVTGAAGGITSAITADLATASGGTFYLLDMVPEPDPNNPELKLFATDKDALKRTIFARIQASGVRATPALVEKEIGGLERAQAALNAINAVKNGGGTAHYFSVNLTNAESVAQVMEQVRQRSGRIDVLLHAAGMERSHFLPDKDPKEFDLVFDVKSDGWFNLLRGIGDMPLGATVAFSSIAGRFGNGGQADYSSANDLLCKITSSFRTTRPATRGIVIDWTAWGGIGMATRGSIPKMMEIAGIDMLPPDAGIPTIRRELTSGGPRGEVLVAQRLGILMHEFDATGGLDPAAADKLLPKFGPMIGKVASMGVNNGLVIETTLDPAQQAFLHDHQIGGTPVLPGVMGIESFAEAALAMLPGWHIEAIENINFLAPFKYYRSQPRTFTVHATISQHGDSVIADCKLIGSRTLPKSPEPEVTTHFTGRVILTKQAPAKTGAKQAVAKTGALIKAADIYRIYFHGPAYQVMQQAWQEPTRMIGELAANLPANHQPAGRLTVQSPRMIEFCFQTAGLWEISVNGRMGLPLHVDHVSIQRSIESASGPLYAVVTPDSATETFDVEVVDGAGNLYMQMDGYKTVALPDSVSPELLKALHAHA